MNNLPIIPCKDMILVEFKTIDEHTETPSGLIVPNDVKKAQKKFVAQIVAVGPEVKMEGKPWKLGTPIVFNQYDLMKVDMPDDVGNIREFGLIQEKSIFAVYNEDY